MHLDIDGTGGAFMTSSRQLTRFEARISLIKSLDCPLALAAAGTNQRFTKYPQVINHTSVTAVMYAIASYIILSYNSTRLYFVYNHSKACLPWEYSITHTHSFVNSKSDKSCVFSLAICCTNCFAVYHPVISELNNALSIEITDM